ncbi:MAG: primosomal protein N' [Chloroflexi bacterium]|nr:MAG: primosomal protein N' [Chloroflexota bacterium]
MPTYFEISVNVAPVTDVYHYHLPPELEGKVGVGHLVQVPFGSREVQGVVLRQVAQPNVRETKAVIELIDPEPVLTPAQIVFAQDLAEKQLAPISACISLMIPPGLAQQSDTQYSLRTDSAITLDGQRYYKLNELQNRLINHLKIRGPQTGRQIDRAFPRLSWKPAAQGLIRRGYISAHPVLPPPSVQPKSIRTVALAAAPEIVEEAMPKLSPRGKQALERRQAVMRYLLKDPGPVEAAWVYAETGANLLDLKRLAELGLVTFGEGEIWRDPLAQVDVLPTDPPDLTKDQEAVLFQVCAGVRACTEGKPVQPYLLFGVTGSGKTEIYMRAAAEAIKLGKQAIILVPEIALTPQTVRRFLSRFPGRVGLVHSRLSEGERYDTWRRARLGQLSVIVGPRSALFTPCLNLGLIVVDEAHDDSYYQSDIFPNYHASSAAVLLARLAGAVCLLGTATPDIITNYQAHKENWNILSLPDRILAHKQVIRAHEQRLGKRSRYHELEGQAETIDLPPVQIVDMRQELKSDNRSIFSRAMQNALKKVLEDEQQAILFLNRRGTATYVFCRDCGYSLLCPRCELPLTVHNVPPDKNQIEFKQTSLQKRTIALCHYCNYERKVPTKCPTCGSDRIRQFGTGTESVETQIQSLFPQARTLRWDYETTRTKGAHEIILSHFANHRADFLIGTQMIAKGLDLPLVTLVGMVLADVGLNLPDYRAPERTFQLLTQVAGRAGRSPLGGQVILQTFQPDNYVIQAASRHDYHGYYREELEYRKKLGYPPYSRMVRLEYRNTDFLEAESVSRALAEQINNWIKLEGKRLTEIIGPAPCFFSKIGGYYRWQIVLRGPNPAALLKNRQIPDWRIEVDPVSLL